MSQPDQELNPLEAAYLAAQAKEEAADIKPQRERVKKVFTPGPNFKVSVEEITEQIAAATEDAVARRRTVHIEPAKVSAPTAEEIEKGRVEALLRGQASRIGRAWSNWVNNGRASGWKKIDPETSKAFTYLMIGTVEQDLKARQQVVESFAEGLKLEMDQRDIIADPNKRSNVNRVDFVLDTVYRSPDINKMDILAAAQRSFQSGSLVARGVTAGGFLCASFEALAGYSGKRTQSNEFSDFIKRGHAEIGAEKPFNGTLGALLIAKWLGRDEVKAYFQKRQV